MTVTDKDKAHIEIVYDGECPFCNAYVRMLRLKEHFTVELIDARGGHALVTEIKNRGLDINEGMVVKIKDKIFFGAEAMQCFAMLSSKSGILRRIMNWVFKVPGRAKFLYPFLKFGRNTTLQILGRKKI